MKSMMFKIVLVAALTVAWATVGVAASGRTPPTTWEKVGKDWVVRAPDVVDWDFRFRAVTNASAIIQSAIDDAFRSGGGTVRVRRGRYNLNRGLRLRSRVTLYFEADAYLIATRDCRAYDILKDDRVEPVDFDYELNKVTWKSPIQTEHKIRVTRWMSNATEKWNNAIIRILNAHDVAIIGEPGSVIDGANSYDPDGEEGYRGVHGISGFDSTNLVFRGFTLQHTGNWAIRLQRCTDIVGERLTILGGHDGFHTRAGERVRVEDCRIDCGDDGIAGYDNHDMLVKNCDIASACSAFRLGGRDILVEDCRVRGPCTYNYRGSLTPQEKRDGLWDPSRLWGRRATATFFLYFCDVTVPLRYRPGNIVFRNCRVENVSRLIRYNFGGETWQHAAPLTDLVFENVQAEQLWSPIVLNASPEGGEDVPLAFTMRNCEIGFRQEVPEVFSCVNVKTIELDGVTFSGTTAPLVRAWGPPPKLEVKALTGLEPTIVEGKGAFKCPEFSGY